MTTNHLFRLAAAATIITGSLAHTDSAFAWPDDRDDARVPLSGGRPPVAPGQLRPTGELRPVGGNLRPVGGNIRPTGGSLSPVGTGIRPIEVRSPLQDDRSFNARTRPRTPVYGVTGTVVEPGFDNPPWNENTAGGGAFPASSSSGFGRVFIPGRAARDYTGPIGIDLSSLARRESAAGPTTPEPSAAYDLDAARAAAANGAATSRPFRARDDAGWFEVAPASSRAATKPRDVRAEVRLAARLASRDAGSNPRLAAAVEAMRDAVYASPESFAPQGTGTGMFADDAATQERLRAARAAAESSPPRELSASDAAFLRAALSAALGESDAALTAIREARDLGESRPSGKALHRVLSRPRADTTETAP